MVSGQEDEVWACEYECERVLRVYWDERKEERGAGALIYTQQPSKEYTIIKHKIKGLPSSARNKLRRGEPRKERAR